MKNTLKFELQKLTLLDYPGKVAATVFLYGCNFRCPFCHNAELVNNHPSETSLTPDDFAGFLSKRKSLLDGICITGGEPLMYENVFEIFRMIKSAGLSVKLDTNGSFPERLQKAIDENLVDAVAMDIKNSPEKYDLSSGVSGMWQKVSASVDILKNSNLAYYEFRTTLVAQHHTADDILTIAEILRGANHYFLQKFVDSGNLLSNGLCALPDDEMRQILSDVQKIIPAAQLRGI